MTETDFTDSKIKIRRIVKDRNLAADLETKAWSEMRRFVKQQEELLREFHAELTHCTAEAFRVYHQITDPGVDDQQYRLADKLRRLRGVVEDHRKGYECTMTNRTSIRDYNWISVKDLLPLPKGHGLLAALSGVSPEVLVAISAENGLRFVALDQWDTNAGEWMNHTPEVGQHVTHWMRLPEPPAEDPSDRREIT